MSKKIADDLESLRAPSPPPTYVESNGDTVLDPSTNLPATGAVTHGSAQPASTPSRSILSRPFGRLRQLPTSNPPSTPNSQPTVLTWQPSAGSSSSAQGPARYIFSSVGVQSMVLAPLTGNWDANPLYYISWREEYFSPGSLVTTIYKGANEHAPFLAEFGLGIVRLGGAEHLLSEKLVKSKMNYWSWSNNGIEFNWSRPEGTISWKCSQFSHAQMQTETLASLKPADFHSQTTGPSRLCELKVYPEGQDKLDDIVICALMLERHRLEKERNSRGMNMTRAWLY